MQTRNVPLTGPRYWWAITGSSIFGVNLGDFIARNLHMGHWQALPVLALLFAGVLVAERRSGLSTEAYYWMAVVLTRTAATNVADLATHDFRLDYIPLTLALLPVLASVIVFGKAVAPMSANRAAGRLLEDRPLANAPYWLALFIAEVIGTVDGDALPDLFDITQVEEFSILGAFMVAVFVLRNNRYFQTPALYWVTILVIATVGLSVGDFIAHSGRLWLSTLLTGLFFVAVLLFGPKERHRGFEKPGVNAASCSPRRRRRPCGSAGSPGEPGWRLQTILLPWRRPATIFGTIFRGPP
jgi:uncharacterized membrane-anchored protein